MPGAMPARRALLLTTNIFCNGGLPSSTATACERSAGSARRIASTGKSGTKMQAKGMRKQFSFVGDQPSALREPYAVQAVLVTMALADCTGLRSVRERNTAT